MQVFQATIEVRSLRKVKVIGRDLPEARANLGALPPGARLISVNPASWTRAVSGTEALAYLTSRDYLDWQGQGQTVQDWLIRAAVPGARRSTGPRSFDGVQTRCIELPFDVVVPPVSQAAE